VAHGARHEALFSPTAIAIHDDGNVCGTCHACVHDSILWSESKVMRSF
jgi:hypothetical protein